MEFPGIYLEFHDNFHRELNECPNDVRLLDREMLASRRVVNTFNLKAVR